MSETGFAPIARNQRIDVLDILRGFAILGIFYMNIPYMGATLNLFENDVRSIGWSVADRNAWATIQILLEGTQRGLLQMLFGAGMIVLARRAMEPDGPVGVADLYYRRNLWLIAFGLFDVFVLLWAGDILFIYGLAALALFPFRRLSPKWLVTIGLGCAAFIAVDGAFSYAGRAAIQTKAAAVEAKVAANVPLTVADKKVQADWQKIVDGPKLDEKEKKKVAVEQAARGPGATFSTYAEFNWNEWFGLAGKGFLVLWVIEAFCVMLIGVAFWKWGFIQGGLTARAYLGITLAAYGFGLGARALGVAENLSFSPAPKTIWVTWEFARIATSIGHIALINLLVKSALGARLMSPFKAAGRTAFSLYFLQQIVALYILFAPFGLGLWAKFSWAGLAAIATAVIIAQLIIANIWVRYFASGPLEWLWRSLAYLEVQPFRRRAAPAGTEGPTPA